MKSFKSSVFWLTISLWGICFVHTSDSFSQIKESPKQRLTAFIKWTGKENLPFEGDCFNGEGYVVNKIDEKCIQKYIKSIEATGLFSSLYIKSLQQEFNQMKAEIKKNKYAYSLEYDRYTISQDPPEVKDLITALNNNSTVSINGSKAKIIVKLKRPYSVTYTYSMDLENNVWKLTKIEAKD
ncbi:hypothetical protein Emtol_4164 [Emticicia oligotrophica DSM 17448]|uniref:DUF3828 domain-containing protein n=1 Tax=Emticicia oligotrophica (strain DSM 17448 / CIP 109782 / MTCC 6937 / GPTSA100-15) TaxID=929562 RepID=A0ABM5N7B9_EMTOG|nr:hypothetical protein [Emticicia oligotrophica]AFK05288.1 hypothetical protein Emtol_4164 [Emticicia oligotrophica DSM 17448]